MQRRLRNRARARRWPQMWALFAVVALSWAMALPAAAQRIDSDLKAAWQAIEAWDLRGARARLEDLKKARPGTDPLVARLAAQVLFEEGRLDEAVAALDAVGPAVDEGDEIARLIRDTRA
ncbi:MAG: tetratricopeptide repeat protein, partial [Myxococcaceae bacterium]|nr:tetratricopeptide repeat protein [Myxococcaceae bacterium]